MDKLTEIQKELEFWKQAAENQRESNYALLKENSKLKKALEEANELSGRWEKAFVNADKQYLKMEKQAAELRRKLEALT